MSADNAKLIAELDACEREVLNCAVIDHDRCLAMLGRIRRAALSAQSEPVAWQPIETAPKGRKLIVGYRNELGKWRSLMGRFYPAETLPYEDGDYGDDGNGYAPEGWYDANESREDAEPITTPTHWMPLPSEPNAHPVASAQVPELGWLLDLRELAEFAQGFDDEYQSTTARKVLAYLDAFASQPLAERNANG